jgi:hypothetical protein
MTKPLEEESVGKGVITSFGRVVGTFTWKHFVKTTFGKGEENER